MAKRHNDALAIACGAVNPSGIAHALIEACDEARAEPGYTGNQGLCDDPAIRLIVHQLTFLTNGHSLTDLSVYRKVSDACATLAKES